MDEYSDEDEDEMCEECGVYQNEMREPWNHYGICPACEKEWEQFEDECMQDFGKRIGATVVKVDAVPDIEDNQ